VHFRTALRRKGQTRAEVEGEVKIGTLGRLVTDVRDEEEGSENGTSQAREKGEQVMGRMILLRNGNWEGTGKGNDDSRRPLAIKG